jgi:hypothetical protein
VTFSADDATENFGFGTDIWCHFASLFGFRLDGSGAPLLSHLSQLVQGNH